MASDVVASGHLKLENGPRIAQPVRYAIQQGWPAAQSAYDIDMPADRVVWFIEDLLTGARGPFAELLIAIADAQNRQNEYQDEHRLDADYTPDWWHHRMGEPVVEALARCLASMHYTTTTDDRETYDDATAV